MLTDAEIATLTVEERRTLIERLALPIDELVPSARWLMRTRRVRLGLMVVSSVVMVPWIVYLGVTLPHHYVAHNWDVAWVGFDLLLLALLVATAALGYLRRSLMIPTSFATGVLLLCDAWFDVLTSDRADRPWSLVTAVVVELPLALLLITGALQLLRLVGVRFMALESGAHVWDIPFPLPLPADDVRRLR